MREAAKGEPKMKILVLSDSHRALGAMLEAAEIENPDVVIHLGDHVSDAEDLSYALNTVDFYMVKGNCDFGAQAPETILTELGGRRFFLTHGHLFGVKRDLSALEQEANRLGAEIALFGHTHRPFLETCGGVQMMNPGAARDGRYGVIELTGANAVCTLKTLSGLEKNLS